MADDAAGTDGNGDDERRPSSRSDPDAYRSIDERRGADDGVATNRNDRVNRAGDSGINAPASGDDADEYRIPLDLSGNAETASDEGDGDDDEDDSYSPEPSSTPIEPGSPDLENVIFVFLGAIAMAIVLVRVVTLPL